MQANNQDAGCASRPPLEGEITLLAMKHGSFVGSLRDGSPGAFNRGGSELSSELPKETLRPSHRGQPQLSLLYPVKDEHEEFSPIELSDCSPKRLYLHILLH